MKRFQFNLEKILRLRMYNEKNWEIRLGEVVSKCNRVQREIRSKEYERVNSFKKFRLRQKGIDYLKSSELYFSKLEADRFKLKNQLEELNKERIAVQKEYLKASKERKVIEKLKERKSESYYREQFINEIKELDDINTQAAVRNRL